MPHKIKRDRYFWTISLQTVCINIFLGSFGPSQPLLREDQHTSLTVAGLHGTALGVASVIAGFANPRLIHRFGRATTGWYGLLCFIVGLIGLVAAPIPQLTIFAALIVGFGSSIVINASVTSMNTHFGKMAPIAITQANAISSVGYVSGTLIVGTIATAYRDFWRLGMLSVVPLAAFLYFFFSEKEVETHVPSEHGPQSGKLSLAFWLAWIGFVACIASEFATAFWAAALVIDRTGSTPAISTLVIAALGTGMGLGRWYWGRILKKLSIDSQLKTILIIQLVGFSALWLSHNIYLSFFMLLIVGLGESGQFAFASVRLIGLSDNRPDLAVGKSSLAAGVAIGGAPFLLGVLGDSFGISRAYIMVPVLIAIAYIAVLIAPSHVEKTSEL